MTIYNTTLLRALRASAHPAVARRAMLHHVLTAFDRKVFYVVKVWDPDVQDYVRLDLPGGEYGMKWLAGAIADLRKRYTDIHRLRVTWYDDAEITFGARFTLDGDPCYASSVMLMQDARFDDSDAPPYTCDRCQRGVAGADAHHTDGLGERLLCPACWQEREAAHEAVTG